MPRTKLNLSKETLAELTADEMAAVNGAAGDSDSCSCTALVVCIGRANPPSTEYFDANIYIAC